MSKLANAMSVVGLLALSAGAGAKDKMEPRAQAMLACASITPDAARLRCFDQSVLALKQGLDQGDLILNESREPRALEGVVKASGPMGANRYWIEFENGDRWQLIPSSTRDEAPRVGGTVKVRKGVMGNYWISGSDWQDSKARFLRRGS